MPYGFLFPFALTITSSRACCSLSQKGLLVHPHVRDLDFFWLFKGGSLFLEPDDFRKSLNLPSL